MGSSSRPSRSPTTTSPSWCAWASRHRSSSRCGASAVESRDGMTEYLRGNYKVDRRSRSRRTRPIDRGVREEGAVAPGRQHLFREQEGLHLEGRRSGWSWDEGSPARLRGRPFERDRRRSALVNAERTSRASAVGPASSPSRRSATGDARHRGRQRGRASSGGGASSGCARRASRARWWRPTAPSARACAPASCPTSWSPWIRTPSAIVRWFGDPTLTAPSDGRLLPPPGDGPGRSARTSGGQPRAGRAGRRHGPADEGRRRDLGGAGRRRPLRAGGHGSSTGGTRCTTTTTSPTASRAGCTRRTACRASTAAATSAPPPG